MHKKLARIQERIDQIKNELMGIGEMRPGSLTKQYHDSVAKKGSYYQLSYTREMKSRTEYVRPEFLAEIRVQVKTFARFRKLVRRWAELAIEQSRTKISLQKGSAKRRR